MRQFEEELRRAVEGRTRRPPRAGAVPNLLPPPKEGALPPRVHEQMLQLAAAVKGLFQSPNYAQSLAIGDKVGKSQYEMARRRPGTPSRRPEIKVVSAVEKIGGPRFA